jgi:hypothetical protein
MISKKETEYSTAKDALLVTGVKKWRSPHTKMNGEDPYSILMKIR